MLNSMKPIPSDILTQFEAVLKKRAVDELRTPNTEQDRESGQESAGFLICRLFRRPAGRQATAGCCQAQCRTTCFRDMISSGEHSINREDYAGIAPPKNKYIAIVCGM